MRAASPHTAAFVVAVVAVVAVGLSACAGKSDSETTILAGMEADARRGKTGTRDERIASLGGENSIQLPYRGPGSGGIAYRVTLEVEGERAARSPFDSSPQPPVREENRLEAEFRELPVEDADSEDDVFLLGLDGLFYAQKQSNPKFERVVEIADDRLRVRIDGETSLDNRGNRVVGPLAPRAFLNRIFGVVTHDASGNPTRLSSRGSPAARDFMNQMPTLGAIAYAMVPLPADPVVPGSRWTGVRIPPSRSGELGLSLTVDYTLTGFDVFDDVPCAMILLHAEIRENAHTGLTGLVFDSVQAALNGTAWVELENSLVRRVVLSDQIRASWTGPGDPKAATEHRIQHASKLELALRNPKRKSKKWSDGTPRFDSR